MATPSNNLRELRELLVFGFDTIRAFEQSLADDGRITRRDLPNFFGPGFAATAAFDNLGNPVARYRALSSDERLQLVALAAEMFDLPDDRLEGLIEHTLKEVAGDIALVVEWQAYLKDRSAAAA